MAVWRDENGARCVGLRVEPTPQKEQEQEPLQKAKENTRAKRTKQSKDE